LLNIAYLESGRRKLINGTYVPTPQMERIATSCWELNPSLATRPRRDAGWIRNEYKDLRTLLTLVHKNKTKSGEQFIENKYDAWYNFAAPLPKTNDAVIYAGCILDEAIMDSLGKALPEAVGIDTGELPQTEDEKAALRKRNAENRRRQREKRQKGITAFKGIHPDTITLEDSDSESEVTDPSASSSNITRGVESVIKSGLDKAMTIQALEALSKLGTDDDKEKSLEQLRKLAGIV